jgi:hypothetical protein
MIFRIIIGFLIAAGGFMIVWKSEWFQQNVGSISWAEEKMASMGGSRMMYKLIGLAALLIGFLAITNLHKSFFLNTFGRLLLPPEARERALEE